MLTFSRKVRGIERIERNSAHTVADRARRYVEKMPPAISGSGGHNALFAVARVLIHGFDLPEDDAWQIDVNVPLILWNPRLFPGGQRLDTIGGHVDLNATVAELMGIQPPGDWQGHSMFDPARPQRAYYLASIGEYCLASATENGNTPSKPQVGGNFLRI